MSPEILKHLHSFPTTVYGIIKNPYYKKPWQAAPLSSREEYDKISAGVPGGICMPYERWAVHSAWNKNKHSASVARTEKAYIPITIRSANDPLIAFIESHQDFIEWFAG